MYLSDRHEEEAFYRLLVLEALLGTTLLAGLEAGLEASGTGYKIHSHICQIRPIGAAALRHMLPCTQGTL